MTTQPNDADPARLFRTLGDPARLRLLRLLAWEELNVAEICRVVGLPQPTVSRQLALLKESGLVSDRKSGSWVFHRLATDGAAPMTRTVIEAVRPALALAGSEHDKDRTRLDRVLKERQQAARHYYGTATEGNVGTRQSRFGDATAWRTLAGLLPRRGTIVDLGTGAGDLLPQLAARAGRVVALDFSGAMLTHARARAAALRLPNITFIQGDLEAVPLADASADGVIASLVLHHAARPEVAVREMARILAPGGRAVVVDFLPHREDWLKDEEGDVWPGFDPKTLLGWFGQAGFGEILIEEGPAPVSSGRRDRPGADRRLKNLRLQWVEAVRNDTPGVGRTRPTSTGRPKDRTTVSTDSKHVSSTQPRTRR